MRVLISGSSGLIGQALVARLANENHEPVRLRRDRTWASTDQPLWQPIRRGSWDTDIGNVKAVVHLAGENIAARRWSYRQKQRIRDSRILGTQQLCRHLARLDSRPAVLVAASAIGYYGQHGEEILTETSPPGDGFLAQVCRDWEGATQPAVEAGIRVINLRTGMVLSSSGGALARLLPLFRTGLGGRLGSGRQYVSWITLVDLVSTIVFALRDESLAGPVNAVSPNPVTNARFTRTLGKILHRPTVLSVPAFVLRLTVGQMADEMLLASARVQPQKILNRGFAFAHPDLESALKNLL